MSPLSYVTVGIESQLNRVDFSAAPSAPPDYYGAAKRHWVKRFYFQHMIISQPTKRFS
jgi:hypothetical protein